MNPKVAALQEKVQTLKGTLDALVTELADAQACEPVDVTKELEVARPIVNGQIRLYLSHNGNVIIRSGSNKPLALTSYAKASGYTIKPGQSGLRGNWFKVFKHGC